MIVLQIKYVLSKNISTNLLIEHLKLILQSPFYS